MTSAGISLSCVGSACWWRLDRRQFLGREPAKRPGVRTPIEAQSAVLSDRRRWRQHQRFTQLDDVADTLGIGDLEAQKSGFAFVDKDFPRLGNPVVEAVKSNPEYIVLAVIYNAKHWYPLGRDL